MKNLATTLLAIAVILFLASSSLFIYHFATTGDPKFSDLPGVIVTGILACFAIFMRRRASMGIPLFKITDKDEVQIQELRREFGVRNILGGLLVRIGGLLIITSILSPILWRFVWFIFVGLLAAGIVLVVLGILLERSIKQ